MIRPRGPLGFVALTLGAWVLVRSGAIYWLSGETVLAVAEQPTLIARAERQRAGNPSRPAELPAKTAMVRRDFPIQRSKADLATAAAIRRAHVQLGAAEPESASTTAVRDGSSRITPVFPPVSSSAPADPSSSNLTGSAWALVRAGGDAGLATGGQLGGSQAGVRVRYTPVATSVALFGRVSAPIEQRLGREAAVGVEWQPLAAVPIRLAAERRIALDRGARDAFAVGLFGGVDQVRLPARFRLDAYGQAGVVGARSRDAYVDGQVRVEQPLLGLDVLTVSAGAGVWGAAQPGVSRLDVGPQLVLRAPLADRTLRLNLDWRQRVAGNARPGSGAALTLATDF